MAPTLHRGIRPDRTHTDDRARDWAEIQERMLVPLYASVHDRLGVGAGTRLLALNCGTGLALLLASAKGAAVAGAARPGSAVVLAGWGPPERCATASVLRVAARLAEPRGATGPLPRLSGRDDLEELAAGAGLRPDGSGRVSCPFGYPDQAAAVRGLVATGLFDAAVAATDRQQVDKEIAEALHPYRRLDGTIRMDNVFRYLIARV